MREEELLKFRNVIGLEVEVLEHPDNSLIGLKGRVVMETKNTFVIECTDGKERTVLKLGYLAFELPNGKRVVIRGEEMKGRLDERIKRVKKF